MPQWRYYGWPVVVGLGEEGAFQGDLILHGLGSPPKNGMLDIHRCMFSY